MLFQNINKSDDHYKTLLHLVAQLREVKLVKRYLKLEANIFLNSYDRQTVFALVGNKEVGRDNIFKGFDRIKNEESIFKTFVSTSSVRMHEVQPKNSVAKGHTSAITLTPQPTRYGEHEVRSRGARDRRALTGEAGNVSRRQVMVEASAWRRPDESGPNLSRVMRTNFGDTMAKIFCEHSDSLRVEKSVISLMFNQARRRCPHWLNDLFNVTENSNETSIQDERKEVVLPSNTHPFNTS